MKYRWILCPKCGKHIAKVRTDTKIVNFPAYCKICKKEILITYPKLEPVSRTVNL